MSTRSYLASMTSLEPIRAAVASRDGALVEALVRQHVQEHYAGEDDEVDEDDLEEIRGYIESMIACQSPPRVEPGCWNYVISMLAQHYQLDLIEDYAFNEGWKHYHVWEPYRLLLAGVISRQADTLLGYLEDGRPLRGAEVEHDGCSFAWLTPAEVALLSDELGRVDNQSVGKSDLVDFHETLVESLQQIAERRAVLFLQAH